MPGVVPFLVLAALAGAAPRAVAPPPVAPTGAATRAARAMDSAAVVTVVTADGASHAFDRARLAALPQMEVRAAFHDGPEHAFRGPTLQSVLEAAGVPMGRALRGEALATVVVAEAADGYRVAYSLGELDEGIVARPAIVALAMDGGPLEPKDGAARLLLAGEQRPSRWIRQLVRLRVVRLPA